MAEKNKLFREVAMQRQSSPEQLDQILQVTTPKGWIALLTIGGLIITALVWGVYGSVPSRVKGLGIFIQGEGVKDISAPTAGQITEIYVSPGDKIYRGQMIARIAQPQLITDISHIRSKILELQAERKLLKEFISKQLALQTDFDQKKESSISSEIQILKEQIKWLEKRREDQQKLRDKGLITNQKYLSTLSELNSAKQNILTLENQKKQLSLELLKLTEQQCQLVRNKDTQLSEVNRTLIKFEQSLEDSSKVLSAHSGRILEVTANEGSLVLTGTRIASLELEGDTAGDIKVVIYVPASQGANIRPGMKAHISPSTVKAEEYGVMLGIITHVGEFPATNEGMMRILRNDRLVQHFSGMGAPIEIFISPIPSPHTFSGYKWSSSRGPEQSIHSGTLASSSITIQKQAPITLVVPWLKKNILGFGADTN